MPLLLFNEVSGGASLGENSTENRPPLKGRGTGEGLGSGDGPFTVA